MWLLIILMVGSGRASNLEDRAQMLLYAKDSKSLKMKINSISNSRKMEVACDFELSNSLIPKSCYKLKLSKDKIEVIDQACERASLKMKEPVDLSGLSKICSDFVNKKNSDIQYSQIEEAPEDFIR